jgi:hypothetical protein
MVQVRTKCGAVLNLRAKECYVLNEGEERPLPQPRPLALALAPSAGGAVGGSTSTLGTLTNYFGPTSSATPRVGLSKAAAGAAPPKRPSGVRSGQRSGHHKRSTDIVVGQSVTVLRHTNSSFAGQHGKVTASRNGYLIVQLTNGRAAYFRGKVGNTHIHQQSPHSHRLVLLPHLLPHALPPPSTSSPTRPLPTAPLATPHPAPTLSLRAGPHALGQGRRRRGSERPKRQA